MSVLFWVAVGYCLAVLVPVPWLSQLVLDTWKKVLGIAKPVVDSVTNNTNSTPKN